MSASFAFDRFFPHIHSVCTLMSRSFLLLPNSTSASASCSVSNMLTWRLCAQTQTFKFSGNV